MPTIPIQCTQNSSACASYSGLSGTIYLFSGHGGCPNQLGSNATYGPTIFHEAIHSCGLYQEPYKSQPLSIVFNEIMKICTGYDDR